MAGVEFSGGLITRIVVAEENDIAKGTRTVRNGGGGAADIAPDKGEPERDVAGRENANAIRSSCSRP
jgi:hypothetical protein